MSRFKEGDRVRIIGCHPNQGYDTVILRVRSAWCKVSTAGLPFPTANGPRFEDLELIKEKEMKYKVGDELESREYSWTRTVLNVFEYDHKQYVVTKDSDDDCLSVETLASLKADWTVQTAFKELTLDEVAKKFGVDVSKIRIKD